MSTITPRFKEELRARITLSDLIGRSVRLTRAGREFKGCCPFHNEKTPSFYVNDDKQFYHCFGCGAHGDVIGFTMQQGNLSFIEAVEQLANEAGLPMPKPTPQEAQKAKEEKSQSRSRNSGLISRIEILVPVFLYGILICALKKTNTVH